VWHSIQISHADSDTAPARDGEMDGRTFVNSARKNCASNSKRERKQTWSLERRLFVYMAPAVCDREREREWFYFCDAMLVVATSRQSVLTSETILAIDLINVCNVYQKFLPKTFFFIFVKVYYFNKRHMKCRKIFVE